MTLRLREVTVLLVKCPRAENCFCAAEVRENERHELTLPHLQFHASHTKGEGPAAIPPQLTLMEKLPQLSASYALSSLE